MQSAIALLSVLCGQCLLMPWMSPRKANRGLMEEHSRGPRLRLDSLATSKKIPQ